MFDGILRAGTGEVRFAVGKCVREYEALCMDSVGEIGLRELDVTAQVNSSACSSSGCSDAERTENGLGQHI
jgi:hypothetical protein